MNNHENNKKKQYYVIYSIGGVAIILLSLFLYYKTMPVLQWGFYGWILGLWVLSIFITILYRFVLSIRYEEEYDTEKIALIRKDKIYKSMLGITVVLMLMTTIVPFITSAPIFGHADQYRNLIGKVKPTSFKDSTLNVSLSHIRVIDEANAELLGDKKLGEDLGLGSRVEIGKYNIQKVNDELFWVAPLNFRSFFKWWGDEDGTEGFIMVSAQNSKDVRLITELNGKKLHLKYLQSAYFGDYIKRYIYLHGYNNIGLTDYTFEVDDNLKPYYVVTTYEKTVGFEGANVTGVLTVDVQSGEITQYTVENAPAWVDRIQPESIIKEQLNDWGQYIYGWWNSIGFSEQKEVTELTDGQKLVYGNDNNSYWYSGLTSIGKDDSIIGFMLTNTRTKETFFYKQSGATEKAAMKSAEGKVQEKRYNATFPSLYKIADIPTYVLTLTDDGGLVKLFAMVSVEKYEIVGIGTTLKAALRDYKSNLYSQGNNLNVSDSKTTSSITSSVRRIGKDIRNGYSYYYIQLKDNSLIFVGNSNISDELPLTQVNDKITLKYKKQSDNVKVVDILFFDNSDI